MPKKPTSFSSSSKGKKSPVAKQVVPMKAPALSTPKLPTPQGAKLTRPPKLVPRTPSI